MDWSGAALAAGRIAGAATGSASAATRAAETLDELRALIPYRGATLGAWDPGARSHLTVAGSGYLDETAEDLNSSSFLTDKLGQVTLGRGLPTRWRDLPFEPETSEFFQRTLEPCGFAEGMAAPLIDTDGRHVGLLNVNTDSAQHPDDAAVEMVRLLSSRFASVVRDLATASPALTGEDDVHRLALSVVGDCTPLEAGWSPSEELRQALRAGPVEPVVARFLVWERGERRPWHVVVEPGGPAVPAIARVAQRPVPGGLSRRELQVLGGVADGLTNQEVAAALHTSPRTVSTHVEHILAKLGVRTRTEAATRAHRDGLLLREA